MSASMPDEERTERETLQFDRMIPQLENSTGVLCAGCGTPIGTEYFQVNGNVLCGRCRQSIEAAAETPRGVWPLVVAGVYGLGAGIGGAAIYYAVIAIAHLEIGIVAILIGYMVGYSVRKGARGRGGRRFQILAAALTYASVALAYTPIAVGHTVSNLGFLFGVIAALPVLMVVSSLPFGLISAFIIFIGMKQAWRMTAAPALEILGPYRVGTDLASASA
jgi:hypothetical protein